MKISNDIGPSGLVFAENPDENVLSATHRRIREAFARFDQVIVSFSGGKDSTVCLMIALEVAKELGRLPLPVVFYDDECLDPDTIAYIGEVRQFPDVQLYWVCAQIIHTLRSQTRDHWVTWDDTQRSVWAREMPAGAITREQIPGWRAEGENFHTAGDLFANTFFNNQSVCYITGIRTQESYNRRRSIMGGSGILMRSGNHHVLKPIFDWKWEDVWKAIVDFGWPHSAFYDKLWMIGKAPLLQRVAPWGNVAGSKETEYYSSFYPEFWERVILRLPEIKAMSRYGRSSLYVLASAKPDGITWQQYTFLLIERIEDPKAQKYWVQKCAEYVRRWQRLASCPLPEEELTVEGKGSLFSWKKICQMVAKNDLIVGKGGGLSSRDNY